MYVKLSGFILGGTILLSFMGASAGCNNQLYERVCAANRLSLVIVMEVKCTLGMVVGLHCVLFHAPGNIPPKSS